MKVLKTFTYALAAAVALAFSSSSQAAILTTTNDMILTVSLTLSTNNEELISESNIVLKVSSVKLANKDLLTLLGGNGFNNEAFSSSDQIAIAFDSPWDGDVVVVDKTGTNVLFDATKNNGNTNSTLAINLRHEEGTLNVDYSFKPSGSEVATFYNNGSFTLLDRTNNLSITGNGPSTIKFTQNLNSTKEFSTNPFGAWNDSATFDFSGAGTGENVNGFEGATISGTVTGHGTGKGLNNTLTLD
jgi:hypothetical protein